MLPILSFPCWMTSAWSIRDVKNIEVGDPISATIRSGLNSASAVIVIVSPGSLKSQWVPYEVGFCTGTDKRVIPFVTHPALDLPGFTSDLLYANSLDGLRNYFANNPNWNQPTSGKRKDNSGSRQRGSFALRTTENKIIIRPELDEPNVVGGIVLPDPYKTLAGIVLAVGEDVRNVSVGDKVSWISDAQTKMKYKDEVLVVVRECDIATIES